MKADDSSLDSDQYRTVHDAAKKLLDRADARGRFPTPVGDLMEAAGLRLAPVSMFDEIAMLRYLRDKGEQVERLLRRAKEKILGILDVHADTVHVDDTVSKEKQTFVKLHETGHNEIQHQKGLFRWIQDCRAHLAPDVAELFEREANTFATIVLFQDDGFARMVADEPFGIKVPMKVSKKFGGSVYAGIREYVRRSDRACAVIVLDPPQMRDDVGRVAMVRRIEMSQEFSRQFGALNLPDVLTFVDDLMRFVPLVDRKMSRPDTYSLPDLNGEGREIVGEGFSTPFNTFILIHATATLRRTVSFIIPPPNRAQIV